MHLFQQPIPVLFYSRSKLICGLVFGGENSSCNIVLDIQFDLETLAENLFKLKNKYGNLNWHLVIADELSYVFKHEFSKTVEVNRTEILSLVQKVIPEDLTDEDWDFKILSVKANGDQEVEVFCPVQLYWQKLKLELKKAEIEVLVVESESMALARHKNPLIGILEKRDLTGKDSQVLNIQITRMTTVTRLKKFFLVQKNQVLASFLVGGLILLVIIFSYLSFKTNQIKQTEIKPNNIVITEVPRVDDKLSPTPAITPELTLTVSPTEASKFLIQITNSSGQAILATNLKAKLQKVGFKSFTIVTSSATTSATTTLEYKENLPKNIAHLIENVLKVEKTQIATLSSSNKVDIVIRLTKKE